MHLAAIFGGEMIHRGVGQCKAWIFCCLLVMLQGCYLLSPQIKTDCSIKQRYLKTAQGTNSNPAPPNPAPPNPAPLKQQGAGSDSPSKNENSCYPCSNVPAQPTLESALVYAQATKDEYAKADDEYSSFSTPLALALIPVSAAALGLGISGVSGAPITGLGMGAATGLGSGIWLQNKPREGVYEIGEGAIQCVIDEMQGFALDDCSRIQLKNALYGTTDSSEIDDLNRCGGHNFPHTLLDDVKDLSTKLDDFTPHIDNDKLILTAGRQAVTAADLAYEAGAKFFSYSTSEAGRDTVSGVDTINIAVASAVKDTEPSIQSLATSLSGAIPTSARQLAGLGAAATQGAAQAKNTSNGIVIAEIQASAGSEINDETTALLGRVDFIITQVGTGEAPATTVCEKMAQAANESKPLTLNPSGDITLTAGASAVTIALSGGKPEYKAAFQGVSTGLSASVANTSTTGVLTLTAAKATPATTNPVLLFVSDTTGAGKIINVTVKAAGQ